MEILIGLLIVAAIFVIAATIKIWKDHKDYNKLVAKFNKLRADYNKLLGKKHEALKNK